MMDVTVGERALELLGEGLVGGVVLAARVRRRVRRLVRTALHGVEGPVGIDALPRHAAP
jgi:hypothetical protein